MPLEPHAWWTIIPPALQLAVRLVGFYAEWRRQRKRRRRIATSEQRQLREITQRIERLEGERHDRDEAVPADDDPKARD